MLFTHNGENERHWEGLALPSLSKRYLVIGRETLSGKDQHVIFTEKAIDLLPRRIVDVPYIHVLQTRAEGCTQSTDLHRSS